MEDHPSPIVKGKRTKRQRPQSPVPFELATSSHTPASSAEIFSTTTEEEEDMANCLILLAQGHEYRKPVGPDIDIDYHNQRRDNHINKYCDDSVGSSKFTSRRYLETATSNGSRAGYYVYECKTCNRTFPSFQALGGHRASHKKPKNNHLNNYTCSTNLESLALPTPSTTIGKRQMLALLPSSSDDEGRFCRISSLSLQLGSHHNVCSSSFNRNYSHNAKNANTSISKVHECSICGAEFTSGQALGGHMRRHRAMPVGISNPNPISSSAAAITTLSLTPLSTFQEAEDDPPSTSVIPVIDQAKVNNNNINLSLDLDLNLPASAQDHQHSDDHRHQDDHQENRGLGKFPDLMNTSISPSSSQQQQIEPKSQSSNKSSMVFSASPALVDCHY